MTQIPKAFPQLVDWAELARNNQIPDARFVNQVGNGQNFVNAYSRKEVFSDALANYAGAAGPDTIWRGYFHSGHAAIALTFDFVLSPAGHPATDPYVTIAVTKIGGATTSIDVHWGAGQTGKSQVPNSVNATERTFAIDPDADYSWSFAATGEAVPLALSVYERGRTSLDNSINWMLAPSYGYSEIYAASRQRISEGLSEIWRRNGGHILSWSRGGSTSPTITGVTWTNVLDATTAVAATSLGYTIGNGLFTSRMRQSQTAPKCILAVYGSGLNGEVRLQTDHATTLASVTGITNTPGWFVSAVQVMGDTPAAFAKADLQFRVNGGGATLALEAACLFLYET